MNLAVKPGDEIVRVDRQAGTITFQILRADKSLERVTLGLPIWTHIEEIGFIVHDAVVSEPDQAVLMDIRRRHPQATLPSDLRQLRVHDEEGVKISVMFSDETDS